MSGDGDEFPIVSGIRRFAQAENCARSFAYQWQLFSRTLLDSAATRASESSKRRSLFVSTW
jgi:hypothetical protein